MSDELQALCFLAGANSIFYGEKLLTTGNPDVARDQALLERLGIKPMVPAQIDAAEHGPAHVHGPDCDHATARPAHACNATRQR
jgi:biotin synthase